MPGLDSLPQVIPRREDTGTGTYGAAAVEGLGRSTEPWWRAGPRRNGVLLAAVLVGLVGWAVSLRGIDVDRLGSYGLLAALPALWFVALGVLAIAAVVALSAVRPSGPLLACVGIALVIVLYATIPAVTDLPQYAYVYKHIGVTRFIEAHHGVDRSVDLYHRWPGFFALAAFFGEVAGRPDPVTFAAWAEPFFAVVDLFLVAALARTVLGGTRVPWLAAYLFTAGNWIGQNYFAPQAISFTLVLAIYVIVAGQLTHGPGGPGSPGGRGSGRRMRLLRRVLGSAVDDPGPPRTATWPAGATIAAILVLTTAVVVSHQLTPYLIVLTVGVLTALGVVRPRWLVAAMAVISVAYLVPNLAYIRDHFGLFSGADAVANATNSGVYVELHKSAGKILYARAGLALFGGTWLAAVVSVVILLRRRATRGVLLCSGAVIGTGLVLFLQTYGGEGRLRVFLFSLPWCAILIAAALLREDSPPRPLRAAVTLGALVTYLGLWLCAFYIPFDANHMTRGDVASAAWLYDHGDPRIPVMFGDTDWPGDYSPRYAEFARTPKPSYALLEDPVFRGNALGRAPATETAGVISTMGRYGPRGYLVLSQSQVAFAHSYGLAPDGTIARIGREIQADRHFTVVYRNPDATIYLFTRDAAEAH